MKKKSPLSPALAGERARERGASRATLALVAVFLACIAETASAQTNESTNQPAKEFPAFAYHRIDNIGNRLGQTALADVDCDGDLDWISGEADHAGARIWWWEYRSPGDWLRHPLGKGNTDVGGAARDVNGDGWIDFLSGSVLFLHNGDQENVKFVAYSVGTIYSHDTEFADVNGDGRFDAIANSDRTGLFWYEIPDDPRMTWRQHLIAAAPDHKVHGGVSPQAVGDIDGDGDPDVVTAGGWYENLGEAERWRPRLNIDFGTEDKYGVAVRTWVGDMDGDDDLDVVQSEADCSDGRVAWFENDGRGNWTTRIIRDAGQRQDFHALVVADFDLDGDYDVFSGTAPLSAPGRHGCYFWENPGTHGGNSNDQPWVEHLVSRQPCHEAVGGDVDGDGDVDVCSKPWSTGNEHFFLENKAIESR